MFMYIKLEGYFLGFAINQNYIYTSYGQNKIFLHSFYTLCANHTFFHTDTHNIIFLGIVLRQKQIILNKLCSNYVYIGTIILPDKIKQKN